MDLSELDFVTPMAWRDPEKFEWMRWLRHNDPVYWSEKGHLWVVTKYADVSYVSRHNEIFCSGKGIRPGNPTKLVLIGEDEPRHNQMRGLIKKGFTPRMVKKLEVSFKEIVRQTLDDVATKNNCDFVADIAVPVPILLIAEMMGVHQKDRQRFHHWSDDMMSAEGSLDDPVIAGKATTAFMEYSAYMTEIIEERRKDPQDDLVSILTGANDRGLLEEDMGVSALADFTISDEHFRLANNELIMACVVLLIAGNETTRNGISGGMQLLIENPDERQKVLDDRSLIPSMVEEMVRMTSPVQSFSRTVTQDTELRGKKLKKDDVVLMIYPSANRDEDEYKNPDTFDVTRNPHHLGFGIGNHFCLGANLARMEMCVTFAELLKRLPDMEYASGGPIIKPHPLVRACARMDVRYSPERKAA